VKGTTKYTKYTNAPRTWVGRKTFKYFVYFVYFVVPN